MLGKLIKHEFRATARVMLPLFAAELALALTTNLTTRIVSGSESGLARLFLGLIAFAFGLSVFAVGVMSLVLMIQRFYKNLLNDEGYLMFTLPAGVHSLVWSKLIVSSVWFIAAAAMTMLSGLIAASAEVVSFDFKGGWTGLVEMLPGLDGALAANLAGMIAEGLVIVFLGCVAACLMFYAAMAVGYGFSRRKGLLSVAFFFLFWFLSQFLVMGCFGLFFSSGTYVNMPQLATAAQAMAAAHRVMLTIIASELIYCGLFYVITTLNLSRRLNLE